MSIKSILIIPILYFLAIAQSSFLPHFGIIGQALTPVFILIILSVFFMPSLSFIIAILGGIFLDIFSVHFLGFNVLILLGIIFFIRLVLKRYVQVSFG